MSQNLRHLARKIAVASCVAALAWGIGATATSAQTIASQTFSPNGNVVTTDTEGNTYKFNINGVIANLPSGTTIVPVTEQIVGDGTQTIQFTVRGLGNGLFTANGPGFGSNPPISCTVDARGGQLRVVSGNCGPLFPPAAGHGETELTSVMTSSNSVTRSQSTVVTDLVLARIRQATEVHIGAPQPFAANKRYHGLSAGSADATWGVWGDASGSILSNDTASGYEGTSVVALAGIDHFLDDNWLVGFATGYTHSDVFLRSPTGTRFSSGAVVSPYISYLINSNFSVDAQLNYTLLGNDVNVSGVNASYQSDRITGATNLNVFLNDLDPFRVTGYIGYSYTWEGGNSVALNAVSPNSGNIRVGMVKAGGEVSWMHEDWEVFVPLTFQYEVTAPGDGTSRAAIITGGGLRYQWTDTIKGEFLVTTTEVKTHTQDILIGGNLRISF